MRMNLRVAIGAASALRALQLIDLRIYGSPGFQFHRMKSGELIPSPIDQNRCAHWRNPMDMMRQG